jgi:membrane protease YdiL (CAAX protease family)
MNKNKPMVNYRFMIIFAIVVGFIGIAILLLPDFELGSFLLAASALGGLIGGSNSYEEFDRQRLKQSYRMAFEWLLLVLLIAYVLIELSIWFGVFNGIANFLNQHWPGFIICVMCILMGLAGFQRPKQEIVGPT